MLELQEERAEAAHFPKRERAKKDQEEAKDSRNCSAGSRKPRTGTPHAKATHTISPHQHLTPPCTSLGSPSMHSSNPKVRNSPSANTQSSPKSKQEAMVRSPPVMSPSSAAQMDSKLSSQGKQGGTGGQSQASPCDSKTLSSGHTAKVNLGLKNGQGLNSGSTAKSKAKRERSTSAESCEQPRDPGTPGSELEQKEVGLRAKRVCVAERRQPYSGTDWCSGDESDEEERSFFNCNSGDAKPQDPSSLLSSNAAVSCSSTPSHNAAGAQNSVSDSASNHKAPSNVVYVFTTEMANKAADAVMGGVTDSIITFHMKNISNKKGEKPRSTVNTSMGLARSESKGLQLVAGPTAQQPEQNHQPSAKVPPGQGAQPAGLSQDGALLGAMDSKGLASSSPGDATSQNGPAPGPAGIQPGFPVSEPPKGPEVKMVQQHQQMASELMSGMGENPEGLSQEQLEHRERSLQTLRDIQRMLFPDEKDFSLKDMAAVGQNNAALPPPIAGPLEAVAKESEPGPLQAMMAQSQSLGKPAPGVRPDGPPFSQPSHRDMPFSPEELGPPQAEQGEHLTPEQVAWLKLQQEFYEEKKRKQEQLQHGPRGSMRAPPPPYQVNPGEVWGPGGPDSFPDQMNVGTRPILPPHRMPGLMNPDMDSPGPVAQPGMGWPDDIPKMGDGRGFPPGQGMFGSPGGRGERFLNPQVVTEGLYQQGVGEKPQMGLPPGMLMDINRMMGHQKAMEPSPNNGGGVIFPRMPGDGPMSPSRMEFIKGREMGEFSMGPRNMNMNPGPQMLSKMSMGPEEMIKMNMGPDEMMKMRQVGAGGGLPPGPLFADQPQPGEFTLGPSRSFMLQGAGHMRGPRGEQPLRPEQRLNPRMSQLAPASGPSSGLGPGPGPAPTTSQRNLGRRPSDLNTHPGPGSSPNIHPLKSPTLGSPSAGLTSPQTPSQTPSQLAAMLTGPTAPTASIKSPPMVGSASTSPVHIKSPSLPGPSPSWTSSPKPPMPSPGVPQHSKPPLGMNSPSMMSGMESGNAPPTAPPLGSSSSQPGPMNLPGNIPSSSPYSMPPEPTLPQNPLSIMMSRMSKFAMPSSTPLYHDAIKTVASSDDDSPPARSPNLPSVNHNMAGLGMNNHLGQPRMPSLSPMAMNAMGSQPHSHGMPSQMPSPNPIGPSMPPHPGPMGPGMIPHGMMMPPGSQEAAMVPQGRMGFPHRPPGFPSGQSPPHQGPFPHNGPGFPHSMGFPGEVGPLSRLGPGAEHAMCKPNGPGGQEAFSSIFGDADLHEVMRPGASGIPEFDLSRIIPSEKPSQTLSYFPRDGGKPPGFPPMQGMMGEGNPRLRHPLPGIGAPPGPGTMGPQDIPMGNLGHGPTQPPNFLSQGMMGPQHRLLASPGMMQSKDRGPIYSHPAPVGSPNMMMSLHGMGGPQQTMMRPRGMATDMGMGFNPGPGNPMF
ncbi:B-cell CLL/lymphoma 9 protein isoform X3 [Scleropages formosus]|uniref:B-cell CLL/lymphoma 9 protein isoform X3 n=1 Tax=Scleropages formosus TaxID=113540 RepID=UPI000878ECDE|nr:B-cell CLL/lymphoma 9 protein-like isoform X3 [Scleropages formosus]